VDNNVFANSFMGTTIQDGSKRERSYELVEVDRVEEWEVKKILNKIKI